MVTGSALLVASLLVTVCPSAVPMLSPLGDTASQSTWEGAAAFLWD